MRAAAASENSPALISLSRVRATSMIGTKNDRASPVPNGALGAAHSFWLRIRRFSPAKWRGRRFYDPGT